MLEAAIFLTRHLGIPHFIKKKRIFIMPKDGRKIKNLPPMNKVSPYIMLDRIGSTNYMSDSVDVANMERYVRQKRESGLKNFGILHVLLSAYVRTAAERPGINRFIRGNKIYARTNGIIISMMIKKSMRLNAMETCVKLNLKPDATPEDIYNQFQALVERNRESETEDKSGFDSLARALNFIPGFLLKWAIKLLRGLDYINLLPNSLKNLSPFHASMFITSMGSLGIPPIFHHLYDFGNIPVFIAYGKKRSQLVMNREGVVEERKYLDFNVCTDERICDGHYFASALKLLKNYLLHPTRLDCPAQLVEDIK